MTTIPPFEGGLRPAVALAKEERAVPGERGYAGGESSSFISYTKHRSNQDLNVQSAMLNLKYF